MPRGLVYILTNPCLDGWVKIGKTDNIERRLRELNAPTNLPLSYRCYAVYTVEDPAEVENNIHQLIDMIDDSLHARETLQNGRVREREFFKMSPERAYSIFRCVASLRHDEEHLKLYAPTVEEVHELEIADRRSTRSNNRFENLNIVVGDEIHFLYDPKIIAKVFNHINKVEYMDEIYSVTSLAHKLLVEQFGWSENTAVNGWRYFTKDGISLSDLRDRLESVEDEE